MEDLSKTNDSSKTSSTLTIPVLLPLMFMKIAYSTDCPTSISVVLTVFLKTGMTVT